MADIVTMLALSPTMEEGMLVRWAKAEGDAVNEGEVLAEVETDKAAMELESFFEGTVLKLLVEVGSPVKVGAPIALIGAPGEDLAAILAGLSGGAPAPAAAPLAAEAQAAAPQAAPAPTQAEGQRRFSSPVARNIARQNNLELTDVPGSGPHGRIIKRDVEAALQALAVAPAAPAAKAAPVAQAPAPVAQATAAQAAPAAQAAASGQVTPLTPMRKTIAGRMVTSWTSAPHFALSTEIDMGPAMALRATLNAGLAAAESDVKLSVNDMVIKACALALRQVPEMNVAWGGDHIVQHDAVHIGVAVAIEGGLITPVVRDADVRSLGAISAAVRDMAARAQIKKLRPEEYSGSTFSVSNLGMYGVTHFQAILNPPEAGILAVGAVVKKPVVQGDAIVPGQRMEVTLSCDHRSSDGAVGARFLQALKRALENPATLVV